nr:hypothetical protein [Candidatus Cloacimonadota bacterium]
MTREEISILVNGQENFENKNALIELLRSSKSLLFIGAGVSAQAGYPSWSKLLTILEKAALSCNNDFEINDQERINDPLNYVLSIKKH